jgi:hypothetical protein
MTTPLDPSSALARLIAAEQTVTPSEAARAANWAGLHARLAAAPASAATVGGALKLLAAAAGGGAVIAALVLAVASPSEPPATAPAVTAREPVREDMPALPAAAGEPVPEDIPTPPTPMPADDGSWDAELTHLQRVQAALREGRAADVLAQVDEYVRRWPAGVFIEEIEAARVLAMCASGGDVAARRALAAFLRRWPESLYGARVRGSCEDRDPP